MAGTEIAASAPAAAAIVMIFLKLMCASFNFYKMLDTTAFNVTVCLCSLLLLTTFPLNLPYNTNIYATPTITTSIMPKVATGKANTLKQPESDPDTQRYKNMLH
jgi:hypothetical protein